MPMQVRWHPPAVPEERKRAQWEHIIRFELGEAINGFDVNLTFAEHRLRWQLETTPAEAGALFRARLVEALRAAGKPVE